MMQVGFDQAQRDAIQAIAPAAEFTWIDMTDFELPDYRVSSHISYATLFQVHPIGSSKSLAPISTCFSTVAQGARRTHGVQ